MFNILFVCLGNICRSPMAEMIFKNLAKTHNMDFLFSCESRAISIEEYGNPMYPKTIQTLNEHAIPIEKHYVAMVNKEDYGRYNFIICMDNQNYHDLMSIFDGDPDNKVHLLSEYNGQNYEIDDPWYTDDFETAYTLIERGCKALFNSLVLEYNRDILFSN